MPDPQAFEQYAGKTLVEFETELGPCFIDSDEISSVSNRIEYKGKKPSRMVGLKSGHRFYVLDILPNLILLFGPEIAKRLAPKPDAKQPKPKAAKRGRKGAPSAEVKS